ncbi:hypothetical protein HY522_08610 [bacterium]|nr:hypothetical protein [bacterium]
MSLSLYRPSAADPGQAPPADRVLQTLVGRKHLQRTVILTPLLPIPLPRQKRGLWSSYEISTRGSESGGITVIRTGAGSESVTGCLGRLFSLLGPAARLHQFLFFGSVCTLGPMPTQPLGLTPMRYLAADHQAFLEGRLSILYSQPYIGSLSALQTARIDGLCISVPGTWQGKMVLNEARKARATHVDQESYWFVSFMNQHRIADYSVILVPTDSLEHPQAHLQSDTTGLRSEFKRLVEALQLSLSPGRTPHPN